MGIKKPKPVKYRSTLRSPSDKWMISDKFNVKKNRRKTKRVLRKVKETINAN